MSLQNAIQDIRSAFEHDSSQANTAKDVENLRIKYLGRKGEIQLLFKQLGQLPPHARPRIGKLLNNFRNSATAFLKSSLEECQSLPESSRKQDITLPGIMPFLGERHPLTQTLEEVIQIFVGMGFQVVEGPEIETEYYNFKALNIPEDHPAREEQDTFYLDDNLLLRTHTSPVQIRVMENQKPPIRIIAPGRVYRRDTVDATHSPIFHQIEGLYVDKGVSFGDLKGTILALAHALFGKETKVRFRPGYFQFTEPSAEYDFSCIFCHQKGCDICKGTGWIEISGSGMVDPAVFKFVDIDPEVYTGFAFGMGLDRITMLKYKIRDIRLFLENDIRFLRQFI